MAWPILNEHFSNWTLRTALYKLKKYCASAYVVVFLYPPSICQKLHKHTGFMHHSVCLSLWSISSAREHQNAVFSLPLSVPWHMRSTTNSSVCRHELFIMTEQIFLPLPGFNTSAGPDWAERRKIRYVGAATAVRCHPPFSRAVAE